MELFVGSARPDALYKARDWFAASANSLLLSELFEWAVSQESQWGQCLMLVEPDVPASDRLKATNIDLILAFSDRVAICEVKNHRSMRAAQEALIRSLGQCRDNHELVSYHLTRGKSVPAEAIRPFLFVPQADSKDVSDLIALQFNKSSMTHIGITGGQRCKSRPALPNGHPLYMPLSVRSRLSQVRPLAQEFYSGSAQHTLQKLLGGEQAGPFKTLPSAFAYVRSEANRPPQMRLPPGHVAGLRPRELNRALRALDSCGIVEVTGSFGIGKSAFIREFIAIFSDRASRRLQVATCNLGSAITFTQLCRELLVSFDLDPGEYASDDALLERLFRAEGIVWIQSYDLTVRTIVKRLLDAANAARGRIKCRFVVESGWSDPVFPFEEKGQREDWKWPEMHIHLLGLDRNHMRKVLETAPRGNAAHSLEQIQGMGNPRMALGRWRSDDLHSDSPELVLQFKGIEQSFEGLEWPVVQYLVCLLDDAPFGIDREIAGRVATLVFSAHSRLQVSLAFISVLHKLEWKTHKGSVKHHTFVSSYLKDLGIGDIRSRSLVTDVNASLAAYIRQQMLPDELVELRTRTTAALELIGGKHLHVQAILGLRRRDLQPLFVSSLRNGMYGAVHIGDWLNRQPVFESLDSKQIYLEHWARVALHLDAEDPKHRADLKLLLRVPPADFALGRYLYQVMITATTHVIDGRPDLEGFRSTTVVDNPTVLAEALCWIWDLSFRDQLTPRLDEFERLFRLYLLDSQVDDPAVRLLLLLHLIRSIARKGSRAILAAESDLVDLLRIYLPLVQSTDNFLYLWGMDKFCRRLIRIQRRDLQNALSRFADDGNQHHESAPRVPRDLTTPVKKIPSNPLLDLRLDNLLSMGRDLINSAEG